MRADNKKSIKKPEGKEPSVSLTIFSLKMSTARYITCYWMLFDIELTELDKKISMIDVEFSLKQIIAYQLMLYLNI